jgi:hypothetical protein
MSNRHARTRGNLGFVLARGGEARKLQSENEELGHCGEETHSGFAIIMIAVLCGYSCAKCACCLCKIRIEVGVCLLPEFWRERREEGRDSQARE